MSNDLPNQAQEIDESMPLVVDSQLANGIRVGTLAIDPARPSDVAVVRVRIPNGSALDGELPGIARFTGSMITRGSDGRTFDEIAEELDGLGASISVGVGGEATDISAISLAEDSNRVIEILASMILRPDFPEREIELVRGQMLSALRQARNSTRAEADRIMRETIYPEGHPFHQPSDGTEESLAAIDRDAIVAFHARCYQASDVIVSVAGGMSHEESVALVDRHLGSWGGKTPRAVIPPGIFPPALERRTKTLPGKSQSDISMGHPSINRLHPDYYSLSLANMVIGRFGLMGRLGKTVRERLGMAYYAYSNLEAGLSVGLWTTKAGVAPQNVEPAIESIRNEVRGFIQEGPTEGEFRDSVGSILGSLPISLETSASMAAITADILYYGLGNDYLRRYRSIITGLTPEAVQSAAREHIHPDRVVVAIVGPDGVTG